MFRYTDRTEEFLSFLSYENNEMSSPTESVVPPKKDVRKAPTSEQSRFQITSTTLSRELLQTNERVKKLQELQSRSKGDLFEPERQRRKKLSVRVGNEIKKLRLKVTGLQQEVEDFFRNEQKGKTSRFPTDREKHQKQVVHLCMTMVEFLEKKYQWVMKEQRMSQRKNERRRKGYFNIRKRKTFNTGGKLLRPVQSHDDVLLMAENSPKKDVESGRRRKALSDGTGMNSGQEEEEEYDDNGAGFSLKEQELQQKKFRLDRSEEVLKVNHKLDQIQQMFMEFGKMVVAQRDLAMRIDDQVTDAEVHTSMAQKELTKYHNTISSNRGLILKVFAILVLMVVFVGLFIIK